VKPQVLPWRALGSGSILSLQTVMDKRTKIQLEKEHDLTEAPLIKFVSASS
jgi:hypothetical protein